MNHTYLHTLWSVSTKLFVGHVTFTRPLPKVEKLFNDHALYLFGLPK